MTLTSTIAQGPDWRCWMQDAEQWTETSSNDCTGPLNPPILGDFEVQSSLKQEGLNTQNPPELGGRGASAKCDESEPSEIIEFFLRQNSGFTFMGHQVPLKVGNEDFFIEFLFYHTRLKSYVVMIKAIEFEPGQLGLLNFYLSAVDAQIKREDDRPTIGLLLCKTKDRVVAEYALSGMQKPMGVAEYELVKGLPEMLEGSLPSIEEIEAGLFGGVES